MHAFAESSPLKLFRPRLVCAWAALLFACSDHASGLSPTSNLRAWDEADSAARTELARQLDVLLVDFSFTHLAKVPSAAAPTREVAVFLHAPTGLEFSFIPPHSLEVPDTNASRTLRLDSGLLACRTECTEAAFSAGAAPGRFGNRPDYPVANVRWGEAADFCKRVRLCLPTQSEWELACRGGSSTPRSQMGRADTRIAATSPPPIARENCNAFGLFDMHGSLAEWCEESRHPYGGEADPSTFDVTYCDHYAAGASYSDRQTEHDCGPFGIASAGSFSKELGFRPVFRIGQIASDR